ncbi:MAG: hypothetical protein AAB110_07990, partial [Candidatus Desantisbacteria bacterium]
RDDIKDFEVPKGTRKLEIRMYGWFGGQSSYANIYFDDLELKITYDYEKIITKLDVIGEEPIWDFSYGNIYLPKNATTKGYNRQNKQHFLTFKNNGEAKSVANWWFERNSQTSGLTNMVRWSKDKGALNYGEVDKIEVYVEPTTTDNLKDGFWVHCNDVQRVHYFNVSANVYDTAKISYSWPGTGSNGMVNIGINNTQSFVVNKSKDPFNPDATFGGYFWKKSAKLSSEEQKSLTANDFDVTTSSIKSYTFSDLGEYTLYCASKETVGSNQIVGDILEIPVRVWELPKVSDTPNTTSSWYVNSKKYIGIKNQPVCLQATGTTTNGDSSEKVEKFIWDFDNDWDTIEKE